MSDKWEDKGPNNSIYNFVPLPGGTEHQVRNTETGEYRDVMVYDNQTTGEAIEKGQFRD